MAINDGDKLNRIEELKSKLFSKSYRTKIEHRDSFTHFDKNKVPEAWGNDGKSATDYLSYQEKFFMKTSLFKNFFLFSLIFLVLTLCYAAYVFFAGGNTVSNENIDISVLGNNFTAGGEELSFVVGITNKNNSSLDLVNLVIEYPKNSGVGTTTSTSGTQRTRQSLGTIPAGAVRNENIKVVLFGEQGSLQNIKITLEYRVEGSNAIFVKDKSYDVTISSTPLNLSIDAPSVTSSNQALTLKIKATLNATKPVSKILLKVDYPLGFQFESAVPAPTQGNNVWNMGDLAPGAERTISVTGKILDAVDGEEKTFRISSGSQSSTDKSMIDVVFNSLPYTVMIQKPFVEAQIFINGVSERQYATDAKTAINGQIRWTNNLDTNVNDLIIQAKISGNAVNRKTINAQQGFYDSSKDVITWDKTSVNDFARISPGDSGSVNFSVSPLSIFSAADGLLPSPSVTIDISISGKQSVSGYTTQDLHNSDSAIIRIISDVGLTAKALRYSGPFSNTGPIPPKVEQKTTYTVQWSLSNTANNISKAVINSSLPSWVSFVGPISPAEVDLIYNPATRSIVWNIGSIPKGTGITTAGKSVSFQVAFTPSLSQVGTTPIIINDAVLTGHDDFANVDVRVSKTSLRTQLDSDPSFPSGGGQVVE
ncbi:MAG: hypothetical protein V4699_02890 [Patescibacteria group bacterium]